MVELLGNLSEHLGMPLNASSHGLMLDQMNGWVHWLMIILFVGWVIFFILTIIKFGFQCLPSIHHLLSFCSFLMPQFFGLGLSCLCITRPGQMLQHQLS